MDVGWAVPRMGLLTRGPSELLLSRQGQSWGQPRPPAVALGPGTLAGPGDIFGEGHGTPLQYSCLENPMDGGAWWAAVHGVAKSQTRLSHFRFTLMHWRRQWQPIPVFLTGESQGRGSLVGCCLWGRTESDTTEAPPQPQGTFLVSQRWGGNRFCWGVAGEARGPVPCGMVQSQSRQGWR